MSRGKQLRKRGLPPGVRLAGSGALIAKAVSLALAQSATGGAADQSVHGEALQEVVVTAQRRSQDILDVPYNISAISGQTIEDDHILDAAELMRSIPGVSMIDRGDRSASVVSGIRIRGLNVDSSALGDYAVSAAATVSTYVNDTPILANFLLTDIDRVEVLKGPQGTLYGSGSLGGTVRYILNAPKLDEFDGRASLSLSQVHGSDSLGYSGTLTMNFPFGDTVALRVTASGNDFPGVTDYVNLYKLDATGTPVAPNGVLSPDAEYTSKKDADFAHQYYGRAALLWKPSDTFDVTFSLTGQKDEFGGRRATSLGTNGDGVPYQPLQVGSVQLEPASRNVWLGAIEANLDLGFATLTSSTSYYDNHGDITSENTGFYAQNNWLGAFYYNYPRPMASALRQFGDKAFIEEVRLVSKTHGRFDYVVGAYYQDQRLQSSQDSFLRGFKEWWDAAYPAFASAVLDDQDYLYRQHEHYRDAALYGELTYHLTDTVDLTGGARLFNDHSDVDVYQVTGLYAAIRDSSDSGGDDSLTRAVFKGNASWRFAPHQLLYATIAEGYRRGGANGTPTTGNFAESPAWLTYSPDTDVDYELGVKGAAGPFTYNADIFYVDWRNPQINTATTNWGFFAVQNAKSAATKGVELQLNGALGPHLHYVLGYTYTDAYLTADAVSADGVYTINTSGARLPGAPLNQFNVGVDYTIPFTAARLTLHTDAYYQSSTQDSLFASNVSLNTVPPPNPYYGQPKFYYTMPGFTILNFAATLAHGRWEATAWVKNVTDQAGVTGVYTPAYMGTSPQQNYFGNGSKALVTLPRTVGLTVSYGF
ncbi:MAG TPA: TonB-dependent receptor [Steroidobacteraceae bacterium]|nr:TonB-dependent receptor [Steroidobacteraceae bacterium]